MNNLTQRIITGIAGAAVMLFCIAYSYWTFTLFFLLLSICLHTEYLQLCSHLEGYGKSMGYRILNLVLGTFIFLFTTLCIEQERTDLLVLIFPLISIFFIIEIYRHAPSPYRNIGLNLAAVFYIPVPLLLLNYLGFRYGYWPVLSFTLIIWANDTFAYFCGKLFGKHLLFPRISPKKTWEGFAGGLIAGILCAWTLKTWFYPGGLPMMNLAEWTGFAMICSVAGTLGDLAESMFKRSIQRKDSGHILPGHGGFLDRFDAYLMAIPFIFTYLACLSLLKI